MALRAHDNVLLMSWEAGPAIRNMGRGTIAWHDGRPAACAFFIERWPGLWEAGMFGTKAFPSVVFELLRWFRTESVDILSRREGRRLQCDVMMGHDDAHRLVLALGARPEGPPMLGYGKGGEAYQRYIWLRSQDDRFIKPYLPEGAGLRPDQKQQQEVA